MRRGFTLIELSIVLAIIATILGSSMAMLVAGTQAAQYNATINTMNTIEQALLNYTVAFNRLPCPSLLTATPTTISSGIPVYGIEATNPGTGNCTGGASPPQIPSTFLYQNGSNTYRAAEGGVPTVSLKLPDSYMYDAWGHRIRYAVDTSLTAVNANYPSYGCTPSASNTCIGTNANNAFPPSVGGCNNTTGGVVTGITIYDSTGAARSSNAAYTLVSHGANGHGAYTATGAIVNAGSTNSAEQSNCHCNSSAGSNPPTYSAQYYQEAPTTVTAGSPLTAYDDIVAFKEPWQLRSSASPASSSNCSNYVYVTDWGNNRVIEMTPTGTLINAWGAGYNSEAGTKGHSGTQGGQFNDPYYTLMDSSGNLWVADDQNYRIQEISPTGQWLMTIGGATTDNNCSGIYKTPTTCTSISGFTGTCCPPGTSCSTCTHSTANGEFNPGGSTNAWQLAFDTNGNLWSTDYGNSRIEEFSTSGTTAGTYIGGWTVPGHPDGIAIWAGYVWVVIPGVSGEVVQYNLTGGAAVGTYTNIVGSGGAPSDYFYTDSVGNLWVVDTGNSRVRELTSSGGVAKSVSLSGAPMGMAIDSNGNVWWSNSSTGNTVVEASSAGATLQSIGSATIPLGFSEAQNIFFTSR